tara:strand:+ start:191 stop:373 length:183 start_codon:yes stop_codon:yes gene_type:complete
MNKEVYIYASQETKDTPILINILERNKELKHDFQQYEITSHQAMKLVTEILLMLKSKVKD